jgi:NADH-quinone oxidoreductase subunit J
VELAFFYVFAAVTVVASLLVIGQGNAMYSVLLLIASLGALSGLYVLLDSPFIAVIQIIVYAGAIMVLFLFVVMLLNAPGEEARQRGMQAAGSQGPIRFGAVLAALLIVQLVWALSRAAEPRRIDPQAAAPIVSSVREIGFVLFTDHGFAVAVTAVLTLVAMIGAVVLASKRI